MGMTSWIASELDQVASSRFSRVVSRLKQTTQEIDVLAGKLKNLDLAEFIGWERRYNLAQLGESLVQGLGTMPLPYVGHVPVGFRVRVDAPREVPRLVGVHSKFANETELKRFTAISRDIRL